MDIKKNEKLLFEVKMIDKSVNIKFTNFAFLKRGEFINKDYTETLLEIYHDGTHWKKDYYIEDIKLIKRYSENLNMLDLLSAIVAALAIITLFLILGKNLGSNILFKVLKYGSIVSEILLLKLYTSASLKRISFHKYIEENKEVIIKELNNSIVR